MGDGAVSPEEVVARRAEMQRERDEKVAALDPKKAKNAHVFLDTLMAMSSPDDMIGVMFCLRAALNAGATKGELMTIISDLATAHEVAKEDAETSDEQA